MGNRIEAAIVPEETRSIISEEDTLAQVGEKVLEGLLEAQRVAAGVPAKQEVVVALAARWSTMWGQLVGFAVSLAKLPYIDDDAIELILKAGEIPLQQVKMSECFKSVFEGTA